MIYQEQQEMQLILAFKNDKGEYVLIDTAGIRRKIKGKREY